MAAVREKVPLRDLRITWTGFAVLLTVFAALSYRKGGAASPYFGGGAAAFAFFAAVAPRVLLPLYWPWRAFGRVMGWIQTRIILSLVFFLVITPIALILKIMRKDVLDERLDRGAKSYWRPRSTEPSDPEAPY